MSRFSTVNLWNRGLRRRAAPGSRVGSVASTLPPVISDQPFSLCGEPAQSDGTQPPRAGGGLRCGRRFGRILLDDEVYELRQWDVVRVAPEVVRAFEAGTDGLDIIAVGGPKPRRGRRHGTATWPTRNSARRSAAPARSASAQASNGRQRSASASSASRSTPSRDRATARKRLAWQKSASSTPWPRRGRRLRGRPTRRAGCAVLERAEFTRNRFETEAWRLG